MPILILAIAIILVIAGINNQLSLLGGLIKEDVTPSDGSVSFGIWILAIAIAGSIGYVKPLRPISNGFLILIFLGILLSAQKGNQSGFFTNLQKAFGNLTAGLPSYHTGGPSVSIGGGDVGSIINHVVGGISGVQSIGNSITDIIGNYNASQPVAPNTVTSVDNGIKSYN